MLSKRFNLRILSSLFVLILLFSFATPAFAISKEPALELTIEEYADLPISSRLAILEAYQQEIYGDDDNTPSISPQYKSGEDDPCHSIITSTAIVVLMNNYGFWQSGSEGLVSALTISLASALPDQIGDESYRLFNSDHFYAVPSGSGLHSTSRSASDSFVEYYNKAVSAMRQNNTADAYQHLGRALHYAQDVTVPFHTLNYLTPPHSYYEDYCYKNAESILANTTSMATSDYQFLRTTALSNIIISTATYANGFLSTISSLLRDDAAYSRVAPTLMPYAARRTAGILYRFAMDCGLSLYK